MKRLLMFLLAVATTGAQTAPPASKAKPEAMITRVFPMAGGFVRFSDPEPAIPPLDPFSPSNSGSAKIVETNDKPLQIQSSREVLESCGIGFPAGARSQFDAFDQTLKVTNTPANMELVEALLDSGHKGSPHVVSFMLTVIEGPGETIRSVHAASAGHRDLSKELASLLQRSQNPNSGVRVAGDAWLETRSGVRASTKSVQEHRYLISPGVDAQGHLDATEIEMQTIGLQLELEPVVEVDDRTIHIPFSLALTPAKPEEHGMALTEVKSGQNIQFPLLGTPMQKIASSVNMRSGETRLLGMAEPNGVASSKPSDRLQAAFLTTHLVRMTPPPRPTMKVAPKSMKVPAGMQAFAFRVPEGLLENVRTDLGQTLLQYFERQGVPPAPGAEATVTDGVLTVVNTHENVERIVALVRRLQFKQPKNVSITVHTVRGTGAYLREMARKAASLQDHGALWKQVQQDMAAGGHDLTMVNTHRLESIPDTRAELKSVREHHYISTYGTDMKGNSGPTFETRDAGFRLECETSVSWDESMRTMLTLEQHPLPPLTPELILQGPGSDKPFTLPNIHFHSQQTTTELNWWSGSTRLLTLLRPASFDEDDHLLATFIQCDLVPMMAIKKPVKPRERKPLPKLTGSDSKELYTRSFRVPPDFLGIYDEDDPDNPAKQLRPTKTAKEILMDAGIAFPPGAIVSAGGATSQLVVRNTTENLDKVERFMEDMVANGPPTVELTLHVLEAPGAFIRQLMEDTTKHCDHRQELEQIQKEVSSGKARHVGIAFINTGAGLRSTAEQGVFHEFITESYYDAKGGHISTEPRLVGLRAEMEPVVRRDGVSTKVNLGVDFDPAPPLEHREHVVDGAGRRLEWPLMDFHAMKLVTSVAVPDGTARLIAVWKPKGKPEWETSDILQAAFLTCDWIRPLPN
ncbi:MAG: hypothetical protein U1F71_13910 [Verrucomicrobiaceae bacterium]